MSSTTLVIVGLILTVGAVGAAVLLSTSTTGIAAASSGPGWLVATTGIVGLVVSISGVLKEWRDEPVDCVAYVSSLGALAKQVGDPSKIGGDDLAVVYGERVVADCGSPADFVAAISPAGPAAASEESTPATTEP